MDGVLARFRSGPWTTQAKFVTPGTRVIEVPGWQQFGRYQYVGRKQTEGGETLEVYYDWKNDG